MARGNMQDLLDILENNAGQPRSIYRSRGHATVNDDDRHAGYSNNKSGRAEHNRPDLVGLRRDIARQRGAAHPLCFTDEVMDHEGAPQLRTPIVTPDTILINPAGPDITDRPNRTTPRHSPAQRRRTPPLLH